MNRARYTKLRTLPSQRILLTLGTLCLTLPDLAAAQDYPHADEPIGTVEDVYNSHLTPDLAVGTSRNIDRLVPTRTISASQNPHELPHPAANRCACSGCRTAVF